MKSILLAILIACTSSMVNAQLRLPSFISSGMVLQQKDSVTLWGWAGAGQHIKVTCSWDNQVDSTISTDGARWWVKVATPAAGGPYTITIAGDTTITLADVMVGEVWLCSGQSNMGLNFHEGEKDIASEFSSASNKGIRLLKVLRSTSEYPQDNLAATWTTCDSASMKSFSSVAYFFGKRLHDSLNVPVGLIDDSWGGTPAETWTPAEKIAADPQLAAAAAKLNYAPWWPTAPAAAYNAMIAPLKNYDIAGCIWYQGEANTGGNATYTKLLTTMIDSWREAFKKPLPFYYVQISPFKYGDTLAGARLQEAQTRVMAHEKTGMVVTTDLIDSVTNIHPSHKKEVGNRLAAWALANTYGHEGINYHSPQFDSAAMKGSKITLSFKYAPTGLTSKEKLVKGFYVSDSTENWYPATAAIQKDKIVLSSKQVKHPVYVRYGFSNVVVGNVFSKEGLPVIPFRTDNF